MTKLRTETMDKNGTPHETMGKTSAMTKLRTETMDKTRPWWRDNFTKKMKKISKISLLLITTADQTKLFIFRQP
jgi:hypothetical protein